MTTVNPYLDLETKIIKRFVIKQKHDRYLQMIQDTKRRGNFVGHLAHFNDFKYELFEEVKGDEKAFIKNKVESLLKVKDCFAISENSEIDQQRLDIDTALDEIIGYSMGTILVFGDAEMIYYEAEGPSDRWITKTRFRQISY